MKKALLSLLACVSFIGLSLATPVSLSDPEFIPIRIKPTSSGAPRTQVPITASVDDETYMLEATFLTDIGMVDVLIQEQSSGANSFMCVDSAYGSASISLPATSGCFIVTFTTDGGDVYEGAFIL